MMGYAAKSSFWRVSIPDQSATRLWLSVFGVIIALSLVVIQDGGSNSSLLSTKKPARSRPNFIFIITDDQDLHLQSLDYLPLIKQHLINRGTLYNNHFCTTAVCCPARVSLWTGKAAHNTNVTDILPPYGGFPKFVSEGHNENYLPVYLQNAGYNTYYTGKLFNGHSVYNYDSPYPAGWTGSDFLLDPYTYAYLNATFQRNKSPPVSYEGQYSTDVMAGKALGFLDEAANAQKKNKKPFFIGISPIAPHSNIDPNLVSRPDGKTRAVKGFKATPPIPAERHAHLFPDAIVPRTANFNPDRPSGASWVFKQPKMTDDNLEYNDEYHRNRLRSLQAVDEMVGAIFVKLAEHGITDDTYVFYTSDNGFHIGQHRLQPGKACGYEEDINVPLILRGPGVASGMVSEAVTTHQDLLPTILELARAPKPIDLDGAAIPLTSKQQAESASTRHEHVTVEYWGLGAAEGKYGLFGSDTIFATNNTYKAIRIISKNYNLYYSVWCNNEHELYDMTIDPGQMNNLLLGGTKTPTIMGHSVATVASRLDALLFVTKTCKGTTCIRPWTALHPQGGVRTLEDALSPRFNVFYEKAISRVSYSYCALGFLTDAEGPQFEQDGMYYRDGLTWDNWT